MKTARIFLKNKAIKTDQDRLDMKIQLARNLLAKGYSKLQVSKILLFIKVFAKSNSEDYYENFEAEIDKITENRKTMGIVELIEKTLYEKGVEVGIEQGIEKGIEQGIEQGSLAKDKRHILRLLKKGFRDEVILDLLEVSEATLNEVKKEQTTSSEVEKRIKAGQSTTFIKEELGVSEIFIEIIRNQQA